MSSLSSSSSFLKTPAYYFFCSLVPGGCLLLRQPAIEFMAAFRQTLIGDKFNVPAPDCCRCFWCCCCCCIDSSRFEAAAVGPSPPSPPHTLDSDPASPTATTTQPGNPLPVTPSSPRVEWVASKPSCSPFCCPPLYLPYLVLAFEPLFEVSIHGLAVLAIVSVDWPTPSRAIHGLGAFSFFYGQLLRRYDHVY